MMNPSDNWKTAAQLESEEDSSVRAWKTLRLDAIEQIGSNLRSPLRCRVNRERYAPGTASLATEIVFDDGVVWIVRVRTDHIEKDASDEELSRRIESEVATMRLIKAQSTIPVPTVFAYSSTPDNSIGFPYVVMSAVVGYHPEDLGMTMFDGISPGKEDILRQYCASLAKIHLQLSTLRSDKIGSLYPDGSHASRTIVGPLSCDTIGPFDRTTTYYHENARRLEKIVELHDDRSPTHKGRALSFWLFSLIFAKASFATPDTGPFLLTHLDLHLNNTLVDKSGNIVCVLDWDSAAFLPIELFATQMFNFTGKFLYRDQASTDYFTAYQVALREREKISPMSIPGVGSSLADLHASVSCRLMSTLAYFMTSKSVFERLMFQDSICEHLFGTNDYKAIASTSAFQEWYAGLGTVRQPSKSLY